MCVYMYVVLYVCLVCNPALISSISALAYVNISVKSPRPRFPHSIYRHPHNSPFYTTPRISLHTITYHLSYSFPHSFHFIKPTHYSTLLKPQHFIPCPSRYQPHLLSNPPSFHALYFTLSTPLIILAPIISYPVLHFINPTHSPSPHNFMHYPSRYQTHSLSKPPSFHALSFTLSTPLIILAPIISYPVLHFINPTHSPSPHNFMHYPSRYQTHSLSKPPSFHALSFTLSTPLIILAPSFHALSFTLSTPLII